MAEEHAPGTRLDVHLPDGGRVTVAVEVDDEISADVELAVANAVVLSGEAESEIEAAVGNVVHELGRSVATKGPRQAKVITVR
jgi:predicted deacylase